VDENEAESIPRRDEYEGELAKELGAEEKEKQDGEED